MNPLVLIHGALGCGTQLESLKTELESLTDREIWIYNCPGHGSDASKIPENGFEMGELATNFGGFLRTNNLLGADIFGYSMGGYIALLAVRNHPERIRHILTLGTKFHWTPESAQAEVRQIIPEKIREKVPKFAVYLESLHGEAWEDVMRATGKLMLALGNKPLLDDYAANFIQHPVVLARGSRDVMVSAEETQSMATSLTDATYEEVNGWPHPIQLLPTRELAEYIVHKLG